MRQNLNHVIAASMTTMVGYVPPSWASDYERTDRAYLSYEQGPMSTGGMSLASVLPRANTLPSTSQLIHRSWRDQPEVGAGGGNLHSRVSGASSNRWRRFRQISRYVL